MTGHRETPESGVDRTLRVVDASHVPPPALASLQAACEILRDAREPLTSISVSGRLPDPSVGAMPVLSAAERLAVEYGLAVDLRLDGSAYEVHFRRRAS
jgi:hypothetical protein